MKRIVLFLITNLAVVLVLGVVMSVVFSVLGINSQSMGGLLVFAAIFGFGGSFISLAISKWIAKRSTGAVNPRSELISFLLIALTDANMSIAIAIVVFIFLLLIIIKY